MGRMVKRVIAILLIGLAWLIGGYVYEYFHPYIDGTIKKG